MGIKYWIGFLVLLVLAAAMISACGTSTGTGTTPTAASLAGPQSTEVAQAMASETPAATTGTTCDHPYFPAVLGAHWTYVSTNDLVGVYEFTDMITDVRSDGFTMSGEFDDLVRTVEWACSSDGLTALQFGGGAAASVVTSSGGMELETVEVTGVTLPGDMSPGTTWEQSFVIKGVADLGPDVSGTAEGKVDQAWESIGMESVTVPAGTFQALKVDMTTTFDFVVTVGEMQVPALFTANGSVWFVEGLGWVRAASEGEIMGQGYTDTLELTDTRVP